MPDQPAAIDLTNYIPKADFEKAINERDGTINSLKDEVTKVKSELLSPEYVEFKTKGKAQPNQQQQQNNNQPDLLTKALSDVKTLSEEVSLLRLQTEWDKTEVLVEKKYGESLADYKDRINKFYQETGNTQMTYLQAYLLIKKADEDTKPKDPKDTTPKKPFSTEKPTATIPLTAVEPKTFKTTEEANAATLTTLKEKYPGLGDHL